MIVFPPLVAGVKILKPKKGETNMRVALLVFLLAIGTTAYAQTYRQDSGYPGAQRPAGGTAFETIDQSRARHSSENYDTYKQHGNQVPLGGYSERLGDPAPRGTIEPGTNPGYKR